MDLNKAQVIGNVTQDIELKQTPNGQNVTSFSIATNRSWTDSSGNKQEQSEFHNVVLWGKLAEIAGQYVTKGQKIFLEGRLQTRNWEAQDGSKRYRTEIVGENLIMLGRKGENSPSAAFTPKSSTTSNHSTPAVKKSVPKQEEEISIEDIPF
ncbi:MAG: single-stranded DNA-binding protein [Candidatus Gracilibacteria bacterium]|nr:single-stranded DNA-binding protein [Candidatus Gracilibacteria bacterium]MDQ7023333.1 single-stranded DNA-binding protein [Candidatus Gracilibacteria bacterium]